MASCSQMLGEAVVLPIVAATAVSRSHMLAEAVALLIMAAATVNDAR